jgi:hypothetical protein
MLRGVGSNQTHGWSHADKHFVNTDKQLTTISGAFHVVTSLATNIIIGNDILAEEGAIIDLNGGTCTFKSAKGTVPITSVRPKVLPASHPSARIGSVFTIKPGFQARVPVDLTDTPPTASYMLDPVTVCEDPQVSRIVNNTKRSQHFAHVMNVGQNIIKLPANVVLARIMAVQDSQGPKVVSNVVKEESAEDRQAFEKALQAVFNIELKEEEREALKDVIRQNRQAFSYGTRKLGCTNLTTMTIETGTLLLSHKLLTVRHPKRRESSRKLWRN